VDEVGSVRHQRREEAERFGQPRPACRGLFPVPHSVGCNVTLTGKKMSSNAQTPKVATKNAKEAQKTERRVKKIFKRRERPLGQGQVQALTTIGDSRECTRTFRTYIALFS